MLSAFLVSQLFAFLLVFCRLGTAIMLMPGIGEAYISPRIRLLLALMLSLIVAPIVTLPPPPAAIGALLLMLCAELLIGLFLGGLARMVISSLHIAGMIIAYQSSLASALTQDITQLSGQSTALNNLLGMTALVLIFLLDLHHVMIRGLVDSYTLFTAGMFPNVADFAEHAAQAVNGAFRMAMQLAAPHMTVGLMLYLAAGIISRLMPNIQVFFIMMPPQLLISFFVLLIAFSSMMMWYMHYFDEAMSRFLAP